MTHDALLLEGNRLAALEDLDHGASRITPLYDALKERDLRNKMEGRMEQLGDSLLIIRANAGTNASTMNRILKTAYSAEYFNYRFEEAPEGK